MKYTTIPNTDLKISKICLGTMTFGEQNTESEAHQQIEFAIDKGVNFLDTAELYAVPSKASNNGLTEKYIGSWLGLKGNRQKIMVGTKIAGPSRNLDFIRKKLDFSPNSLRLALEGSLKRLQTDYVDLYQLHWPERNVNNFSQRAYKHDPNEEWENNFLNIIKTMTEFVKEGKIRYWGLSNETPWGVMSCLQLAKEHGLEKCISIQNPYNLLNRQFEVGLSEITMRENLKLLAYSPMAFGLLSGKYHDKVQNPSYRLSKYKQMARYSSQRSYDAVKEYINLSKEMGISPASLSLAFVNQQPFLGATIIGATNLSQLKENIESVHIELSETIIEQINEIQEKFPNPAP